MDYILVYQDHDLNWVVVEGDNMEYLCDKGDALVSAYARAGKTRRYYLAHVLTGSEQ